MRFKPSPEFFAACWLAVAAGCLGVIPTGNAAVRGDDKPAETIDQERNPYAPPPGLSVAELADYILNLQEKPQSIQRRPGFALGIAEAADRILAADGMERFQLLAIEAKISALHKAAVLDDGDADKRLMEFAKELSDDERPQVKEQVRFLTLERRAIAADKLELKDLPELLVELKEYFEKQELGEKHRRMASSTIRAVNRIEEGDNREDYFNTFGKIFAKSKDKRLAAYGRKLSKETDKTLPKSQDD